MEVVKLSCGDIKFYCTGVTYRAFETYFSNRRTFDVITVDIEHIPHQVHIIGALYKTIRDGLGWLSRIRFVAPEDYSGQVNQVFWEIQSIASNGESSILNNQVWLKTVEEVSNGK